MKTEVILYTKILPRQEWEDSLRAAFATSPINSFKSLSKEEIDKIIKEEVVTGIILELKIDETK